MSGAFSILCEGMLNCRKSSALTRDLSKQGIILKEKKKKLHMSFDVLASFPVQKLLSM